MRPKKVHTLHHVLIFGAFPKAESEATTFQSLPCPDQNCQGTFGDMGPRALSDSIRVKVAIATVLADYLLPFFFATAQFPWYSLRYDA